MKTFPRSMADSGVPRDEKNGRDRGSGLGSQRIKLTGEEIRFLRKTMGVNREKFADILAISKSYLTRLEDGTEEPSHLLDIHIRAVYGFARQASINKSSGGGHQRTTPS